MAIVLPKIPTLETEENFILWINEIKNEGNMSFDFIYINLNRFCIYYETSELDYKKYDLSKEKYEFLYKIFRMTVKGELNSSSEEWK